jgi:hypothetical protein
VIVKPTKLVGLAGEPVVRTEPVVPIPIGKLEVGVSGDIVDEATLSRFVVIPGLRDPVGEDDRVVVLDPFPKVFGIVLELTVAETVGGPVEPGIVPLPKGAVTPLVVLIVGEILPDPVGVVELLDPLPDGVFGV